MGRQYDPVFGAPVTDWFRWFAWRPVYTEDRGLRWLRPLWRRRCQKKFNLPGPYYSWFQHVVKHPDV